MARTRLTDALAKALPAPGRGNKIRYDALVPGFGVRITAAGARAWVVAYVAPDGRERRMTIGSLADGWRVGMAREEARRIRRLADQGVDPLAEREEERQAPTVADVARRYREEHLPRKRAQRDDVRMIEQDILPRLGRLKVADLRSPDVDRLHREVGKRAPYVANRCVSLLSKMMTLAKRWGWCDGNPCAGVQRHDEAKRQRFLSGDELARLSSVLATWPDRQAVGIFRLLLLTGARCGEALSMRWQDVDASTGVWTKPSSHTKTKREHRVPLSAAARAVLAGVEPVEGCPWIFPADSASGHRVSVTKAWAAVTKAAGLEGVRVHDLRHTYASVLAAEGLSLPVIGRLLGHTQVATTSRYAHLADDPLRAATERAGRVIAPLKAVADD